MASVRLV